MELIEYKFMDKSDWARGEWDDEPDKLVKTYLELSFERFFRKVEYVERSYPTKCMIWTDSLSNKGYGQFWFKGKTTSAYKWAFENILRIKVSDGLELDHLCCNRACVNPAHLEIVTGRINVLRGQGLAAKRAAQTHCYKGHEFTNENTIYYGNRKGRVCRECQHIRSSQRWKLKKTASIVIVEKILGKSLPKNTVVYHSDGNTSNNKPNNLVVCPNHAYCRLIRQRQKALEECGNPSYRRCHYCKKWDDTENLYYNKVSQSHSHRECNRKYQSDYKHKNSKKSRP